MAMHDQLIMPLPDHEAFAGQLADAMGGTLGHIEAWRFPDGESYERLHGYLG